MVNSNKSSREAKSRVARMEANQALHVEQLQRRKRDNLIAFIAIGAALVLAVVLALTVFTPKDDVDGAAAPEASQDASAEPSA
ncbi:MAG: peptidylprolyl isomerase, partial [Specibacter sp.]